MATTYQRAVTFFRTGGYQVKAARKAAHEWLDAKARAESCGLEIGVEWEQEDFAWDGDGEAPPIWQCAFVRDPRPGHRTYLACLGGIGLLTWQDGYVREVETMMLNEACDTLESEREATATACASELQSRATFAGVST